MDNRLQLFVEKQDSVGSFIEVDRFNDESVNVVDSIQNVKDISKIFAPFTRAFHLPSSPTNNEVFGYYYNNQVDTYDARYKTRAIIKIGGADYKIGHISMDNSTMIDSNNATSYRVKFTDETITLKDKLGEDKLTNLNYGKRLKLANRLTTIVNGIRQGVYRDGTTTPTTDADGYVLYPDVIYAPIFTKGKAVPVPFRANNSSPFTNDYEYFLAYFDNENSEDGVTTYSDSDGKYRPRAVSVRDYRPAVKVSTMLEMINNRYALGFSDEFIYREELDQLYLWHNGKVQSDLKGSNAFSGEGVETSANSVDYKLDSFTIENTTTQMNSYLAGTHIGSQYPDDVEFAPFIDETSSISLYLDKGDYTGRIDITVSLVVVKGNGEEVTWWTATRGNIESEEDTDSEGALFNSTYANSSSDSEGFRYWRNEGVNGVDRLSFRIQLNSSSELSGNVSLKVRTRFYNGITQNGTQLSYNDLTTELSNSVFPITGEFIDLKGVAPDMKVLDFVSGIFKMFNLTYQSEDIFTTNVQTIDEFYNNPDKTDISEHVTIEGATISRAMIYKDITMKYNKSEDAMSGQYSPRANGEMFPDLYEKLDAKKTTYGSSATAEGSNLSIKSPFTCMMYERLYTSWSDRGWETPYTPIFDTEVNHSAPNAITDVVVGHSIDSDLKKKDIKNLLFYGKKVDTTRNFSALPDEDGNPSGILGIQSVAPNGVTYNEWGNSAGSQGRLVGLNQTGNKYNHTLVLADDNGGGSSTSGNGYGATMTYLKDEEGNSLGGGYYRNQWWNPSNIMASAFRRNGLYMNADAKIQGLQFNNANSDEYEYKSYINTGTANNPIYPTVFNTPDWINGLYNTYYKSYLEGLYDRGARLYKVSAKLPDHLISSYKMNDVYRIGNKEFTINKADINLMNGESSLELLTYIPPSGDAAVINNNALSLTDGQFYDETINFDLEPIRIINNNFPTKLLIQCGSANNNIEYVRDGLIPTNFIDLGQNNYALRSTLTPRADSGQPDWQITNILAGVNHTAYAVLEHSNGTRSNKSNVVSFRNPSDSVAPTATMDVTAISQTQANVDVTGVDNTGGSGIGNVKITSTIFGQATVTQVDQAYNGDPTTFVCSVAAGTLNIFRTIVTDNAGNDSATITESILISIPDTTPPEEPTLAGSTNYNGGFNIDLEIGNIYDNIEVDFVTIMRSVNGSSYSLLDTENINGETSTEYRDAGLDDEDNYKYYVFVTDTSGNVSTNSTVYQYIGDSEGDL